MNTLLGFPVELPAAVEQPRVTPIRERVVPATVSPAAPGRQGKIQSQQTPGEQVRDEQIHSMVQQLFFQRDSKPVRHVGFVTAEASTESAMLCLQVARAIAEEDCYDVGLIDANPDPRPLQTRLDVAIPTRAEATWTIGPRLWMVPRQSWLPDACGHRVNARSLSRLRELTGEFDFSILWCAPVSWLTTSIGQHCDGLVLVVTANKTRRIVAAQIKDQLNKADVPLLGTVLADRRFPVPQGLYGSL
jgi:Mrp family chromosome partitioning ATPase